MLVFRIREILFNSFLVNLTFYLSYVWNLMLVFPLQVIWKIASLRNIDTAFFINDQLNHRINSSYCMNDFKKAFRDYLRMQNKINFSRTFFFEESKINLCFLYCIEKSCFLDHYQNNLWRVNSSIVELVEQLNIKIIFLIWIFSSWRSFTTYIILIFFTKS